MVELQDGISVNTLERKSLSTTCQTVFGFVLSSDP